MILRNAQMMDKSEIFEMVCKMKKEALDKDVFDQVFWENMNHPSVYYVVAVVKDEVVAFASIHMQRMLHHLGMVGEIQEFCIAESFQNQAIVEAMFDNLKLRAIDMNCVQLQLNNPYLYCVTTNLYTTYDMVDEKIWTMDLR